jgi:RNA polymerase sigma-70 factor (ECF subfamily)
MTDPRGLSPLPVRARRSSPQSLPCPFSCGSVADVVILSPKRPGQPAVPRVAAADADCVRLFEREFDYVHRTLRRLGVNSADADDLTQEVFLVVWRRRGDWDPGASLRAWLAAIAVRVAMAHRRRSRRELPGGLVDPVDLRAKIEDRLAGAQARQLVLDALASLPPKHRVILILRELDEIPMRDVAAALKLPLFTAYSRLRVAREGFAKAVRRRQLAEPGRWGNLAVLLPTELLKLERPVPATPAGLRARVLARLRSQAGDLVAAPRVAGPVALGGAAALAALVLLFTITRTAAGSGVPASARGVLVEPPVAAAAAVRRAQSFASLPRSGHGSWRSDGSDATTGPLAEALAVGIVGYWRFDEVAGTTAVPDLSGNGGDCALRRIDSTQWIEGPLGGALRLRGGGYLECPSTLALGRVSREITISAWVMRTQVQANLRTIVARQHGTDRQDDFYLGFVRDRLVFASGPWSTLQVHVPQTLHEWVHVAVSRRQDGRLSLYVNGALAGQVMPPPRFAGNSLASTPYANSLLVGGANNYPDPSVVDEKLAGAIDELVIHDRALGPGEIAALARGIQPRLR